MAWGLAPFLVSYAYVTSLATLIILVFLNLIVLFLVLKEKYSYVWNGILFFISAFIIELLYKIL